MQFSTLMLDFWDNPLFVGYIQELSILKTFFLKECLRFAGEVFILVAFPKGQVFKKLSSQTHTVSQGPL